MLDPLERPGGAPNCGGLGWAGLGWAGVGWGVVAVAVGGGGGGWGATQVERQCPALVTHGEELEAALPESRDLLKVPRRRARRRGVAAAV